MPMKEAAVVHSDPDILGGTPVFVGTRVPVQALIDYIEGGHSLNEFLDDFPTITREIAVAALERAKARQQHPSSVSPARHNDKHAVCSADDVTRSPPQFPRRRFDGCSRAFRCEGRNLRAVDAAARGLQSERLP
jgi:uncharacterized protein (DUF433 family)